MQGRVRLPDVVFISFARFPGGKVSRDPIPSVSPDLVVEVLSESNTKPEIDQKLREYFQSGVLLAWIIDPDSKSALVYRSLDIPSSPLKTGDMLDVENVLLASPSRWRNSSRHIHRLKWIETASGTCPLHVAANSRSVTLPC